LPVSIFNIEVHGSPKLLWAPERRIGCTLLVGCTPLGPEQECNFNFIPNGWARLATRCGWVKLLLLGLPKEHLITFRLFWISNFPCNVRAWPWNPCNR